MDSLTQIVLGSSVAALVVPPNHRRRAILAGGVLGTLPDLDVLWFNVFSSDVVTEVTWHRGPSHSLLVLTVLGLLLWFLLKSRSSLIQASPLRWLLAIWLALITHPLLDAFTVYGTQLLWPMKTPPVMWATIFVIDPLYTVPLLIGVIAAWRLSPHKTAQQASGLGRARAARNWLIAGLLVSSAYLAWSVAAKSLVDRVASQSLVALNLQSAPRFSTPLPFNTLAWRVIVMVPGGYWLGDRSLVADQGAMQFTFHASDNQALAQLASIPQLKRLLWFTQGFVAVHAQRGDDGELRLILADLRMGLEPDYFFRYDIAAIDEHGGWVAAPEITLMPESGDLVRTLNWVWKRIYNSKATL
ncbi:metal-dependent hydrolase [Serratia aquatilis]|uniref:Metal-dependent hydrolase n=1 Tax=Serratia aquatilis TaxID=1737515 RepID=A0ABV6E9F0_9GAMM